MGIIAALFIGAFIGVVFMCMLQISRVTKYEATINNLKEQLKERM